MGAPPISKPSPPASEEGALIYGGSAMSGAKERFERAKAGIAPARGVMDGIRKDAKAEKLNPWD